MILLAPSAAIASIMPIGIVAVGVVGLFVWLGAARRAESRRQPSAVAPARTRADGWHEEAGGLDA